MVSSDSNLNGIEAEHASEDPYLYLDEMERVERIGKGSFSEVYQYKVPEYGILAVKIMLPDKREEIYWQEANLMAKMQHPNVVPMVAIVCSSRDGGTFCGYAMPMASGSLLTRLQLCQRMSEREMANILLAVADGMGYLHSLKLVHVDIKAENVLVFPVQDPQTGKLELCYRVADFGLTTYLDILKQQENVGGTPARWAPEQWAKMGNLSEKVDIFAFGLLILELHTGKAAWPRPYLAPNNWDEDEVPYELPGSLQGPLRKLLEMCTAFNPADRPSAGYISLVLRAIVAGHKLDPRPTALPKTFPLAKLDASGKAGPSRENILSGQAVPLGDATPSGKAVPSGKAIPFGERIPLAEKEGLQARAQPLQQASRKLTAGFEPASLEQKGNAVEKGKTAEKGTAHATTAKPEQPSRFRMPLSPDPATLPLPNLVRKKPSREEKGAQARLGEILADLKARAERGQEQRVTAKGGQGQREKAALTFPGEKLQDRESFPPTRPPAFLVPKPSPSLFQRRPQKPSSRFTFAPCEPGRKLPVAPYEAALKPSLAPYEAGRKLPVNPSPAQIPKPFWINQGLPLKPPPPYKPKQQAAAGTGGEAAEREQREEAEALWRRVQEPPSCNPLTYWATGRALAAWKSAL